MTYEEAFNHFNVEFTDYLYLNYRINNGDMLIKLMERPEIFEHWIQDHHPEIGEMT